MRGDTAERHQVPILRKLMNRPRVRTLVAVFEDDPSVIAGFVIFEPGWKDVVHYLYVKASLRRYGIAKKLFLATGFDPSTIVISHWTKDLSKLAVLSKYPGLSYNPYLMLGGYGDDPTRGSSIPASDSAST